jgi:DNA-directed RNA polymerase specialized sigma24 family protein
MNGGKTHDKDDSAGQQKYFSSFFSKVCQNRVFNPSSKRKGKIPLHPLSGSRKGGEKMKPTPKPLEESKRHQFDAYCKKLLKHTARDYYSMTKLRQEREIPLEALSDYGLPEPMATDEYFKDAFHFSVLDYEIGVTDEALAEALDALPKRHRDIILLSIFLDMNDGEIADKLKMVRRTVAYRKTRTLQDLKKLIEGGNE